MGAFNDKDALVVIVRDHIGILKALDVHLDIFCNLLVVEIGHLLVLKVSLHRFSLDVSHSTTGTFHVEGANGLFLGRQESVVR